MQIRKVVALLLLVIGYLLFGTGGWLIYFTDFPHYAFLFLPPALFSIALSFSLLKKER